MNRNYSCIVDTCVRKNKLILFILLEYIFIFLFCLPFCLHNFFFTDKLLPLNYKFVRLTTKLIKTIWYIKKLIKITLAKTIQLII